MSSDMNYIVQFFRYHMDNSIFLISEGKFMINEKGSIENLLEFFSQIVVHRFILAWYSMGMKRKLFEGFPSTQQFILTWVCTKTLIENEKNFFLIQFTSLPLAKTTRDGSLKNVPS